MIHLLVHHTKRGFLKDAACPKIGEYLADSSTQVWLDLDSPTPDEMALLAEEFRFHPLAIEDVEHPRQRPKIEQYGESYFAVLFALAPGERSGGSISPTQVSLFIGRNYLVTVHAGPVPVLAQVAARWQANHRAGAGGITALLYSLLDAIVDDYFPVMDDLGDRIDELEDRIFVEEDTSTLQPIFGLKRDLLAFRRVVAPERDVVNVLLRRELPFIDAHYMLYFQDVYDHLARLTETVDTFRDILSGTLDAHLSVVSNRLNQVMKTLTAISAMLMSAALIAGIYGMNFRHMPELEWYHGYPASLGLMLAVVIVLAVFFRRRGWL